MDAVLSVQGASAPVKKKSFFSKFTRLNMLRLARAVIPAAVLMMFTYRKLKNQSIPLSTPYAT
ncbi:pilin [Salmonella enterica]|nr:pilin [Salmonella enterica]EAV1028883.1 pilin [Salmonella enterica]